MRRASRALRAASVWAPFLLSSGNAFADDPPPHEQRAAVDAERRPSNGLEGSLSPTNSEQAAAAAAYQQALASYAEGNIAGALASMRQSYQLSQRAELLYNLAELEEELNACSDSFADYRRYLERVPNGRYRETALRASARLEKECPPPAASSPTSASTPGPAPPATDDSAAKPVPAEPTQAAYWTAPRVISWSAIATGALAGVGALYFQWQAIQAKSDLQQDVDNGPPLDTSLATRQHRCNHTAIALAITGGAMVAGGALVLLLDSAGHEPNSRSARVYAAPGLVGAYFSQGF